MGNVTVTIKGKRVEGGRRKVVLDLTFSNSYATNGDTVVAADILTINSALGKPETADFSSVETVDAETGKDGTSVYLDRTAKKFKAFSGRSEVANATDLSTTPGAIRLELVAAAGTAN